MQTWNNTVNVLEFRYPNAFEFWDNAGKVAKEVSKIRYDLQLGSADPSKIEFKDDKAGLLVTLGIDRFIIKADLKKCSKTLFIEMSDSVFNFMTGFFGFETFSRIGNRLIFNQNTESPEKSNAFINKMGISSKLLNVFGEGAEDKRLQTKKVKQYSFHLEDASTGISVEVVPISVKINVEGLPVGFDLPEAAKRPFYGVQANFDIYTKLPYPAKGVSVEELIKSNLKMVETRFLNNL